MSPARSRRSASHAAGTHGWLPQKTGRPGLRRGGVGGYNLHSVPPNSPPDCGTVAHQPRAGCIRLVLKTAIVPIIKNKTGDTSDKHNYRPIALLTATFKLFEICLLKILQMYFITHDHQFGFKTKHSADMCIFTVKSIIKYYTGHNTPVYTYFLDASKAFDRVNHWTLFTKLINSGILLLIIRILVFWYQTQQLCVKWGGSTSSYFTISNGV